VNPLQYVEINTLVQCTFEDNVIIHYKVISVGPEHSNGQWYLLLVIWPSLVNESGKYAKGIILKCCFPKTCQPILAKSHVRGRIYFLNFFVSWLLDLFEKFGNLLYMLVIAPLSMSAIYI